MTLSFEQRQVPQYLLFAVLGALAVGVFQLPRIADAGTVGASRVVSAESVAGQSFESLLEGFYATPKTDVVERSKRFPAVLKAAKTEAHAQVLSNLAYSYAREDGPYFLPYARLAHQKVHELAPNNPYLVDNFHTTFLKYCTYQAGAR